MTDATSISRPARLRGVLGHFALLAAGVAGFLAIGWLGASLEPTPATAAGAPRPQEHGAGTPRLLLSLALIVVVARAAGVLLRRTLGQPQVIGEIVAGLMLGPSLLGAVWPDAQAALLPPDVTPLLVAIAKLGIVLFMFLVGLELDPSLLKSRGMATTLVAQGSIVAPFLLGAGAALPLYPLYATGSIPFVAFALFLGLALAVTAFPVLARILQARGLQETDLGTRALACAATADVVAWLLFALVAGLVGETLAATLRTCAWTLAYVVVLLVVVRPLAMRFVAEEDARAGPLSHTALAIAIAAALLSASATDAIGIHALFGAFALGAVLPHRGRFQQQLRERLEDVVLVAFLPCFFVFTGTRTEIGLLSTPRDWLVLLLLVALATLGKVGGTWLAGRMTGLRARDALALGILMNARGLIELIVLNLGLDLGVISPTLFTMLVLMALVTTFMTAPLLDWVRARDPALAGLPARGRDGSDDP